MKRDMDLIRKILFAVEARPEGTGSSDVTIEGYSREMVRLHLKLMEDASLVEGITFTSGSDNCTRLTWHGYEFLEAARNDTIWSRAKEMTMKKTGGLAMAALTEALKGLVKSVMDGSITLPST